MTRRQFGPELKKKIAIEAIREQRTINEIANEHQVHPAQIRKWKKFIDNIRIRLDFLRPLNFFET